VITGNEYHDFLVKKLYPKKTTKLTMAIPAEIIAFIIEEIKTKKAVTMRIFSSVF
jgi:hypothetical protein